MAGVILGVRLHQMEATSPTDTPTTTTLIPNDKKFFGFQDSNPSFSCHNLVNPVKHIGTVRDLQRRPADYFLVSHMFSRDAVNSVQCRFGFQQPFFNNMYNPYVPRWREHVYPRKESTFD